jgi:acyl carrier protein
MDNPETEIKQLIIDTLELEGISPDDIDADAPLFGAGLGLDSIDALELGMALKKKYHIHIDTNSSELVNYFASVSNLARFVCAATKHGLE